MKKTTTCPPQNAQSNKIGQTPIRKLRTFLRIEKAANAQHPLNLQFPYHGDYNYKANTAYEAQAELNQAMGRVYANTTPLK